MTTDTRTLTQEEHARRYSHPGLAGRPSHPYDWASIERWAASGATEAEIAAAYGVDHSTLSEHARARGIDFQRLFEANRALGRLRLKQRIVDVGMGEAQSTMPQATLAMFAGNNIADWSNKQTVQRTGKSLVIVVAPNPPPRLRQAETPELPPGQSDSQQAASTE